MIKNFEKRMIRSKENVETVREKRFVSIGNSFFAMGAPISKLKFDWKIADQKRSNGNISCCRYCLPTISMAILHESIGFNRHQI